MRISDWSSDVCSSDLEQHAAHHFKVARVIAVPDDADRIAVVEWHEDFRLGGGQAHVMLGKMSAASAEQATPDQPWRAPQHAGKQPRMHPRDTQIVAPDIEMRDAIDRKSTRLNSSH